MIKQARAIISKSIYYIGLPVVYLEFKDSTRAYLLLEASGQVLFVKSWFGNQKYKLPGGGLKKGEDPKDGVVREVYEETGLSIDPSQVNLLLDLKQTHAGANYRHLVYKLKLDEQKWPKPAKFEIMEAVWLSPSIINLTNSNQATIKALKTAGLVS